MIFTRRTALMTGAAIAMASATPSFADHHGEGEMTKKAYSHAVDGGEVVVHPINHSSMIWETPNGVVWIDTVGEEALYEGYPRPDLILLTHHHGDHLDIPLLETLPEVPIIANQTANDELPDAMKERSTVMANGDSGTGLEYEIDAVPAYNNTEERQDFHPMGRDNGYVVTVGGKKFYIAGDTENIPELADLSDIMVAFLPVNLPFTMDEAQAADAVAMFEPNVVYPYHYRGREGMSDLQQFADMVAEKSPGTKVIQHDWYANSSE